MARRADRRTAPPSRVFVQWPVFIGLAGIYGAVLLSIAGRLLFRSGMPPGHKIAIASFLGFLLATQALSGILLNGLFEALFGRIGRWLDPLKALLLTLVLVVPTASLLKFRSIGVHLRRSDLWFVFNSAAQLAQESMASEKAVAVGIATAAVTLFAALWIGLVRLRESDRRLRARPLAILLALSVIGAAACYQLHPIVPVFAQRVLPDVHWVSQRLAPDPFRFRTTEPPTAAAGSDRVGPPIAPYEVDGSSGNRYNVVLIMLESVPWNRAPWVGGRDAVMPNLAELATTSIVFERAYAASVHSDYAQMAILSSLHPRKYDQHDFYTVLNYPRTLLWDALRAAGYRTSLFSCQNERWGNMIQYIDTPGLEVLRHSLSWPGVRHKGSGNESKVYEETPVSEWRRWRERGVEPYLSYFNFQSNHFPYEIPPESERPWTPYEIDFPASFVQYPRGKVPVMSNRFDNALHYADRWIGEVVRTLKERGEWERTVLVVVSDHGEAFYEHTQPTHGTALYEEQVRSLWLMRVPGLAAEVIDAPVSLLDVAPTVLNALELPPHGNFQGRGDVHTDSYTGAGRALPFTIQGLTREDGLLVDGWKLTVNWDRRERKLFDLNVDAAETTNLANRFPGQADRLQAALASLLERQLDYYAKERWTEGYYPPSLE